MFITLSAVFIGTLCFQWLSAYRRPDDTYMSSPDSLALSQVRFEGLIGWGVPNVPALLFMAVQMAIFLFVMGLLTLLWNVNKQTAMPLPFVGGLVGLFAVFYMFPVVIPTLLPCWGRKLPQCPFKNPWSWAAHRIIILPTLLCSYTWVFLRGLVFLCYEQPGLFFSALSHPISYGRFCSNVLFDFFPWWHQSQISLLTDLKWEQYDKIWCQLREGVSSLGANRCSFYLLRGLTSVLEKLGSDPTATYIVRACLRVAKGDSMDSVELDALGSLFMAGFTELESRLLKGLQDGQNRAQRLGTSNVLVLRRDFLNALILQYLVAPNPALHQNFLSLRVELYIRIMNTTTPWNKDKLACDMMGPPCENDDLPWLQRKYDEEVEKLSTASGYIGKSLTCPIVTPQDANSLTSGKSRWSVKAHY
jgi:hypothetical protein